MKYLVFLLCSLALIAAESKDDWEEFKKQYKKVYSNSEEENLRKKIFNENKKLIEDHNYQHEKGQQSFTLKMNHLGDLTAKEFRVRLNGFNASGSPPMAAEQYSPGNRTVPDSIDWRHKGAVTEIKDQNNCSSCWAFSATGSLEGQTYLKTGRLVSLSEQNLLDCSRRYGTKGCSQGGLMNQAFQYVTDNSGIMDQKSYPYEAQAKECRFRPSQVVASCKGFKVTKPGDEAALREAVGLVGPISAAVHASLPTFQFYHKGVYYDVGCNSSLPDHGVLVVGYGNDEGVEYWIIKNSWSLAWGDEGYMRLAKNKANHCGIASTPSFPIL